MGKGFKTRKKYRLTFVNENTFNAVWSVKLSRVKVWVLTVVSCAAVAALAVGLFVWSPLKNYLPGYIRPSERKQLVQNTLLVDSMLMRTEMNRRYVDNIVAILSGAVDSVPEPGGAAAEMPAEVTDTLMVATEAERAFVDNWMERERGNLSVLTPVVAEGMMFRNPVAGSRLLDDGVTLQAARGATVTAIQDATVIDVHSDALTGRHSVILQHANDFISCYANMAAPFVRAGQRVNAGQALGALGSDGCTALAVWHHGMRVELPTLIPGLSGV